MKIRILDNTLRYRLRKHEVEALHKTGSMIETVAFGLTPADELRFCLEVTADNKLTVNYNTNAVTVGVPKQLAEEWATTDRVGFDGQINTGKGKVVDVLVEKDFVCLDRPDEENIGAYPNPNAVC